MPEYSRQYVLSSGSHQMISVLSQISQPLSHLFHFWRTGLLTISALWTSFFTVDHLCRPWHMYSVLPKVSKTFGQLNTIPTARRHLLTLPQQFGLLLGYRYLPCNLHVRWHTVWRRVLFVFCGRRRLWMGKQWNKLTPDEENVFRKKWKEEIMDSWKI